MNSGSRQRSLKSTVSESKTVAKTNPVFFLPPRFNIEDPPNCPLRLGTIADNLTYLEPLDVPLPGKEQKHIYHHRLCSHRLSALDRQIRHLDKVPWDLRDLARAEVHQGAQR
jgi:hypothetical protein